MIRPVTAALVAMGTVIVAAPARAAVQLFDSRLSYQSVGASDEFAPGVGTVNRAFGFSDIGGCEDEGEGPCGGYEIGRTRVTLTGGSFDYRTTIQQSHVETFIYPDTFVEVYGEFRAARQMRVSIRELRDSMVFRCAGSCPRIMASGFDQYQLGNGTWGFTFWVSTSATVREASHLVDHRFVLKVAEIPEPASWAMLIAGFGLVGAAARVRRDRVH